MRRDKNGNAVSQIISIVSFAYMKIKQDKAADILVWANNLNAQAVPIRIYLAENKLGLGRN